MTSPRGKDHWAKYIGEGFNGGPGRSSTPLCVNPWGLLTGPEQAGRPVELSPVEVAGAEGRPTQG
jgi:hypothetical protein